MFKNSAMFCMREKENKTRKNLYKAENNPEDDEPHTQIKLGIKMSQEETVTKI